MAAPSPGPSSGPRAKTPATARKPGASIFTPRPSDIARPTPTPSTSTAQRVSNPASLSPPLRKRKRITHPFPAQGTDPDPPPGVPSKKTKPGRKVIVESDSNDDDDTPLAKIKSLSPYIQKRLPAPASTPRLGSATTPGDSPRPNPSSDLANLPLMPPIPWTDHRLKEVLHTAFFRWAKESRETLSRRDAYAKMLESANQFVLGEPDSDIYQAEAAEKRVNLERTETKLADIFADLATSVAETLVEVTKPLVQNSQSQLDRLATTFRDQSEVVTGNQVTLDDLVKSFDKQTSAVLGNKTYLAEHTQRMDSHDTQLRELKDQYESRLEAIDKTYRERFEAQDKRLEELSRKIEAGEKPFTDQSKINPQSFKALESKFDIKLSRKLDADDKRYKNMQTQISKLVNADTLQQAICDSDAKTSQRIQQALSELDTRQGEKLKEHDRALNDLLPKVNKLGERINREQPQLLKVIKTCETHLATTIKKDDQVLKSLESRLHGKIDASELRLKLVLDAEASKRVISDKKQESFDERYQKIDETIKGVLDHFATKSENEVEFKSWLPKKLEADETATKERDIRWAEQLRQTLSKAEELCQRSRNELGIRTGEVEAGVEKLQKKFFKVFENGEGIITAEKMEKLKVEWMEQVTKRNRLEIDEWCTQWLAGKEAGRRQSLSNSIHSPTDRISSYSGPQNSSNLPARPNALPLRPLDTSASHNSKSSMAFQRPSTASPLPEFGGGASANKLGLLQQQQQQQQQVHEVVERLLGGFVRKDDVEYDEMQKNVQVLKTKFDAEKACLTPKIEYLESWIHRFDSSQYASARDLVEFRKNVETDIYKVKIEINKANQERLEERKEKEPSLIMLRMIETHLLDCFSRYTSPDISIEIDREMAREEGEEGWDPEGLKLMRRWTGFIELLKLGIAQDQASKIGHAMELLCTTILPHQETIAKYMASGL